MRCHDRSGRGASQTHWVSRTWATRPRQVEGHWDGELWALQLDPKSTFDDLVRKHADTPEQADGILQNRLYRNLTEALSGTQEYMAMEKLYELAEEGRFDLIVVDTPPSRNALDFLEAPGRLTRFLGNRIFQFLLLPTRASLRAFTMASQAFSRRSPRLPERTSSTTQSRSSRPSPAWRRASGSGRSHVRELLGDSSTAFVLVSAPRLDTVAEAGWFADRLEGAGLQVDALVVNRVHPVFWPDPDTIPEIAEPGPLQDLVGNLRDLCETNAEGRVDHLGTGLPGGTCPGLEGAAARRGRP